MPYVVGFQNVSTVGLESSPVAEALAGLRANEGRYYRNKYEHVFTVRLADGMEVPEELASCFQVRSPEIKVGRRSPRFLVRDQGRVLIS